VSLRVVTWTIATGGFGAVITRNANAASMVAGLDMYVMQAFPCRLCIGAGRRPPPPLRGYGAAAFAWLAEP